MRAPERPAPGGAVLLFVYGTLRRGCAYPMARRLALHARYLGVARVNGRLYRIAHYPGLLLSAHADEWVKGDLYDLSGAPALLAQLDRYEGLGRGRRQSTEYARVVTTVWMADHTRQTAWLYLYRKSPQRRKWLVSGDFQRQRRRPPY